MENVMAVAADKTLKIFNLLKNCWAPNKTILKACAYQA